MFYHVQCLVLWLKLSFERRLYRDSNIGLVQRSMWSNPYTAHYCLHCSSSVDCTLFTVCRVYYFLRIHVQRLHEHLCASQGECCELFCATFSQWHGCPQSLQLPDVLLIVCSLYSVFTRNGSTVKKIGRAKNYGEVLIDSRWWFCTIGFC